VFSPEYSQFDILKIKFFNPFADSLDIIGNSKIVA